MVRRLFDVVVSALALAAAAPALLLAAAAVRLASPGPALYRGERVGRHGRPFRLYKLRTMHGAGAAGAPGSVITAARDPRVFPVGAWLRRTKLDEVPQLLNVLRGDMSIVGPRPEDPRVVAEHYTARQRETLAVRPGLTGLGSLFSTTHGEAWISAEHAERDYAEKVLPVKLALDLVYLRRASWRYDLAVIGRTAWVLLARAFGRRRFSDPAELPEARRLLAEVA